MNRNYNKYKLLILLLMFIGNSILLYSKEEKPDKPTDFQVIPQQGSNFCSFKWKVTQQNVNILGFKIYYHEGKSEEIDKFDTLRVIRMGDPDLKIKEGFHTINNIYLKRGEYSFYITAFNNFGESEPSDIVDQTIGENVPSINFTTIPDSIAYVGEEYIYDANAVVLNGDGLIKYKKIDGPADLLIDHNSGKVKWTPSEEGNYQVVIQAFLFLTPNVTTWQQWNITVNKCKKPTSISGSVEYSNGGNVESGIVKIYINSNSQQNDTVLYKTVEFTNGSFRAEVDEGTYYLKFEGEKFITEWYEDAGSFDGASQIQVPCGMEIPIQVKVDKYVPIENFIVSGRVTRESDGSPISSVLVNFAGRKIQTGEPVARGVQTNADGYYEVELEGNSKYIASVKEFQNYLPQFYDKVDNVLEATVIQLNSDKEHIDFVLKEKPTTTNKLSGIVKDDEGIVVANIYVTVCKIESLSGANEGYSIISKTTNTKENGIFEFTSLETGKYIIIVNAPYLRKIPGYYAENNFVIRKWRDATKILIDVNTIKENIIIKMPNLKPQESGKGVISGTAIDAISSIPIAGGLVYALDQNNNVRNFAYSDISGKYEMKGMKAGKYRITADKVGYYNFNADIELIDDNSTVDTSLKLIPLITEVQDNSNTFKIDLYPNPASDNLNISVAGLNSTSINFKIFNSLGIMVSSNSFYSNDSKSVFNFNTSNLTVGFYYIKIENGSITGFHPFVISR